MSYSPLYFGSVGKASSRQTQTGYANGSISTILKGTPVSVNTSGQMVPTDITVEASAEAFIGLCSVDTPSAANGLVVSAGRVENVPPGGFSVRDVLYIAEGGVLTNVKPDLNATGFNSGDFVIMVGIFVKNEFSAGLFDIQLMVTQIGQL